jgi:polysaccharide export outer membrane protein
MRYSQNNLHPVKRLLVAVALTVAALTCLARTHDQMPVAVDFPSTYVLGPDDVLSVRVLDVEELNAQTARVDLQGYVDLPLVGRVKAAGLTLDELKQEITGRLKDQVKKPSVILSIAEFHSEPVSIIGAVNRPGVHQLQGHKTLIEALSLGEGLRTDAGGMIKITRRKEYGPIPLTSAKADSTGEFSVATVSVKGITNAVDPAENIAVKPNDVISVPVAEMIYVVGSVKRPGGFVLSGKQGLSALEALSLAEGLERTAKAQKARIIRPNADLAAKLQIPINLDKVLAGKSEDVNLKANDILFVPDSATKNIALRTFEAAIQAGTGYAIYHP